VRIIHRQVLLLAMGLMALRPAAVCAQQAQEPGGEGEQLEPSKEVESEEAEAETAEKKSWLPLGVSGNVAVYTDYSFRGISQTGRDMAAQGGFDFNHDSGLFAGYWASSTNFADTYMENDFYGGYEGAIGDFSYKASATFFYYPRDQVFNYWELGAFGGYDFGVLSLSTGFIGSPDYFGTLGTGFYIPAGISIPLPTLSCPIPNGKDCIEPSLDANGGYTHSEELIVSNAHHYWDWNAGLVLALPFNFSLDFRYVGTDVADVVGRDAADRFIFGAKYSF
jgi:uncharacterized protein (TIGR02001 family)